MKTIWKFAENIKDDITLTAPGLHRVVHVAAGPDVYTLRFWAEVDRDMEPRTLQLAVRGTGHELPDDGVYVQSVENGPFVWHVFERA